MPLGQRLADLRRGFHRTFWIANTLELFERFAFYGSKAVLAVYLAEKVGLGPQVAGSLVGAFSGVLYFLPVLAGTLVDRYGFRRTLAACFGIFTVGYFLIGMAGLEFGQRIAQSIGRTPYMIAVLLLTAVGGSLIKPCIVGTVANTSTDKTRSLGYSIYYTLVNVGGALGPVLALQVRQNLGIEYVLIMSSVTSFALFLGTLLFFAEPPSREQKRSVRTMAAVLRDMLLVFANLRFMLFLIIASGFYILFWQIFYSFPFYVKETLHYERFELLETVDAWTIILLTVPATAMVKRWKPIRAVILGFFIASVAWIMIPAGAHHTGLHRGDGVVRVRRSHVRSPILRVHRESRAAGAGRHIHGVCVLAGIDRFVCRRTLGGLAGGELCARRAPEYDVVLALRDRPGLDRGYGHL